MATPKKPILNSRLNLSFFIGFSFVGFRVLLVGCFRGVVSVRCNGSILSEYHRLCPGLFRSVNRPVCPYRAIPALFQAACFGNRNAFVAEERNDESILELAAQLALQR